MLDVAFNLETPNIYKDADGNIKIHERKNICSVCNGKMIISELTGKPPID